MVFIFTFDLQSISNFLLGFLTGFVLFSLFLALIFIRSKKRKDKIYYSQSEPIQDEVIRYMIEEKQKVLTDTVKVADNAYFRVAFELSFDLIHDIAKHYFPNSAYPIYELSVQELLNLILYIQNRLQKIVNGKIVNLFKNSRISTLVDIINKKKAFDNSKIMKLSQKLKVSKFLEYAKMVLNYGNPIYWFRRFALKPSTTLVIKETCKMIIRITGEETNKVYSKKIFMKEDDPVEIEQKFDAIRETVLDSKE